MIDESGGTVAVEGRFPRLAGEPMRRLTRYPGSAVSWQNALLPGATAFVVDYRRTTPQQSAYGWSRRYETSHPEGASASDVALNECDR